MAYSIVILPKAEADYRLAAEWYRARSSALSKRFAQDFRSACKRISGNPDSFTLRYAEIRICRMDVFPFTVHFYIDSAASQVLIIGIYHQARSPETWTE